MRQRSYIPSQLYHLILRWGSSIPLTAVSPHPEVRNFIPLITVSPHPEVGKYIPLTAVSPNLEVEELHSPHCCVTSS
jgi:hypothetical protein